MILNVTFNNISVIL